MTALAIAAWVLDETPLAVRTFDEAVQSWYATGPLPEGLGGVIALAYFEYGRWDQPVRSAPISSRCRWRPDSATPSRARTPSRP
ncbi:hypothetical protein ACTMTF_44430 [Nonomuraea sp. ZG12]|uniref:hypothetical protein n=1 Tax=Nonomuraea sp. ZG12 TaxID=3452207 RepID=UPI003F8BA9F7